MELQIPWSPYLPAFFTIFCSVYLFAFFVLFRFWGPKHKPEACSCVTSLAHGTPAVVMATKAIIATHDFQDFASPNTPFQATVLEFSIAYFLVDLLHYIIFYPRDILFISHHLATLYVFVTCLYMVHHGAIALLGLLVLAEVTSSCQNLWSIARYRKADVPAAARFYEFISPKFLTFYSFFRGFLGPIFAYKMSNFYMSGAADGVIPRWAWISWMVVIVTAIGVSILWVSMHWKKWYAYKILKEEEKKVKQN